ncbi:hypothetical protein ACWGPQ_02330 [Saccharomonospora azurea]
MSRETRASAVLAGPDEVRSWQEDLYRHLHGWSASEDFSDLVGNHGIAYSYWGIGGIDPEQYDRAAREGRLGQDIPANHSPGFAPAIQPTLDVGTQALVVAAPEWL